MLGSTTVTFGPKVGFSTGAAAAASRAPAIGADSVGGAAFADATTPDTDVAITNASTIANTRCRRRGPPDSPRGRGTGSCCRRGDGTAGSDGERSNDIVLQPALLRV